MLISRKATSEKAVSPELLCTVYIIDGRFTQEHLSGVHSVHLYSNQRFLTLSLTLFAEHGIGVTAVTRLDSLSESIHYFVGKIDMEHLSSSRSRFKIAGNRVDGPPVSSNPPITP
jgi:hypothetical protein